VLFLLFFVFSGDFYVILGSAGLLFADGGGLREPSASCSPPRWGGGELRGSKNRKNLLRHPLPFARPKGNAKSRRGETISGSVSRLR